MRKMKHLLSSRVTENQMLIEREGKELTQVSNQPLKTMRCIFGVDS
jgi:hypothetical protein